MRRAAMLLVCVVGLALPATKVYEVVPYEDFIGRSLRVTKVLPRPSR